MNKKHHGFTLIELLVAIAIIAVLSSVGMMNFFGSQTRGFDARRQSDMNQYRVALENYASVMGGVYPTSASNGSRTASSGIFNSATGPLAAYLTGFPADPRNRDYYYVADATGLNYVLQGCMESTSRAWQYCSNGKSGVTALACATNISQIDAICDVP